MAVARCFKKAATWSASNAAPMKTLWKFLIIAVPLCLSACALTGQSGARELKGMPVVVAHGLAPGAATKENVSAFSDTGGLLFSPAGVTSVGESINAYGGGLHGAFPRWVRVSWRTGADVDLDKINGGWKNGKIVGDYTVKVLERIPQDVFAYVRATPGRAIVLRFHLKDDGVLFAWDVQELNKTKFGQELAYSMHGGDF